MNAGVEVYLDNSLKRFDYVFPACGSSNSAIKLSVQELEELSIKEMEVCYKEQCHEGDLLKAKIKKEEQTTKIGIFREDKLACSVVIR